MLASSGIGFSTTVEILDRYMGDFGEHRLEKAKKISLN
jgi:hypothetical protein